MYITQECARFLHISSIASNAIFFTDAYIVKRGNLTHLYIIANVYYTRLRMDF